MMANNSAVFAVILCSMSVTAAFFTYDDCEDTCKSKSMSSTISEETKKFFLCHCIKSEFTCELLATPVVVCLRPRGASALGGAKIWNDYRNRNTSTTTARPQPQPAVRERWKVLLTGCAVMMAIPSLIGLYFFIKRRFQRRRYSEMRNFNNPYQDTVEALS